MKPFFWSLTFLFLLVGYSEKTENPPFTNKADIYLEIPDVLVEKSDLHYDHKISLWKLNEIPYSGFVVSYYPNNQLKEKFGILEGRKQNEFIQWYPDGHFKNVATYDKGKLHGEKKMWSSDSTHILIAHYNYHKGRPHGEQTKWYPTGELFKKMKLNLGKEDGLQQAFRENGDLYANYEAKDGRIFGLKKAKLCFSLEDEYIKTEMN
ncbi:MAG: hypothetical protein BalsKO_08020 [Balneolaceae bacterium]